jgi:transaldolase
MIASGELKRLRDAGVSGVTANPTIFAKALEASEESADEVKQRLAGGENPEDVIWDLLIEDVQATADVFRPVHETLGGAVAHGFALIHGNDDHHKIELETPMYDALYAWCQKEVARP